LAWRSRKRSSTRMAAKSGSHQNRWGWLRSLCCCLRLRWRQLQLPNARFGNLQSHL